MSCHANNCLLDSRQAHGMPFLPVRQHRGGEIEGPGRLWRQMPSRPPSRLGRRPLKNDRDRPPENNSPPATVLAAGGEFHGNT